MALAPEAPGFSVLHNTLATEGITLSSSPTKSKTLPPHPQQTGEQSLICMLWEIRQQGTGISQQAQNRLHLPQDAQQTASGDLFTATSGCNTFSSHQLTAHKTRNASTGGTSTHVQHLHPERLPDTQNRAAPEGPRHPMPLGCHLQAHPGWKTRTAVTETTA